MSLILIVEDSIDNQVLLEQVLGDNSYDLACVCNGRTALQWLETHHPDLILLDFSLPEMDGWEITRLIRSHDQRKHIPIIAITAHAMKGDRDSIMAAGCNAYIAKPIDIGEVEAQVAYWLKRTNDDT